MKENLEWKEKSSKELLQTKVLSVTERTSTSPEGSEGKYIVLDAPDWVIVIPRLLNPSRFLMVKQWR